MRVPRDVTGADLAKALRALGYVQVRRAGSHIRLTTQVNGEHHVTVPDHKALKTGTLMHGVLKPVAAHHGVTVEELLEKLGLWPGIPEWKVARLAPAKRAGDTKKRLRIPHCTPGT